MVYGGVEDFGSEVFLKVAVRQKCLERDVRVETAHVAQFPPNFNAHI